jgi:hypothetical protein
MRRIVMDNDRTVEYECSRITCVIHRKLSNLLIGKLLSLGIERVYVESARSIRQRILSRMFGLPGKKVELNDTPAEIIRATVPRDSKYFVLNSIVAAAELRTPGRGSVYAQDISEISTRKTAQIDIAHHENSLFLKDLSLITAILSIKGDGEKLADLALKLGGGVPVVTRGMGTSIRDRLGLIRITIPPEKEMVHLVVAGHDAPVLERLLIDEGHIDRPGGGFIYRTPVSGGMLDSLISIGRQEKAASTEQIIAALDELKKGTSWRKRFTGNELMINDQNDTTSNFSEISFICSVKNSDIMLKSAMEAGGTGVTTSYLRSHSSIEQEIGSTEVVRGVLCVPSVIEKKMADVLRKILETMDETCLIQTIPVRGVFSHNRYTNR